LVAICWNLLLMFPLLLVGADRWSARGWMSMSYRKIVSTKVDTYQQPRVPVDPRHAWMNSFDI